MPDTGEVDVDVAATGKVGDCEVLRGVKELSGSSRALESADLTVAKVFWIHQYRFRSRNHTIERVLHIRVAGLRSAETRSMVVMEVKGEVWGKRCRWPWPQLYFS